MVFIDRFSRFCGGSSTLAWLLTVNVATALLLWLSGAVIMLCGGDSRLLYTLTALPSDPLTFATHPWTLVTYMVAHFAPLHMLFNMLWLYWFGMMFADSGRDRALPWLYAGAGIAGGVFYLAASVISGHAPGTYLTGASAAVLGVMTATAMLMPSRSIGLFLIGEVKLKWVATGCIALTLLGSWGTGIPPQVAHIGGILYGIGWVLVKRGITNRNRMAVRRPSYTKSHRHLHKVNTKRTIKAMNRMTDDHERLDQLLDKIRISGYDSLTAREKTELNHISARIEP